MRITQARRSSGATPRASAAPVYRHVLSPAAAVLAAAAFLSACSSEPLATAPDLAKNGPPVPLTVSPSPLLLRMPGLAKTFTATVQYSGLLTANSSNPGCATVSPASTTSTEKPAGSSLYVAQFTVMGVGMHGCTITVTDKKGNTAGVNVIVSPIAFFRDREPCCDEIWLMDADGQNQIRLTDDGALDVFPAWSPDATKIAFASDRDGAPHGQIWVMDTDGQNPTRLTDNDALDTDPAWSPDGTKIAFSSDRDDPNHLEIYVMDADGQNQIRLTNDDVLDSHPTWSPDGAQIAFMSNRDDPSGEIYVMDSDGHNLTRLTNNSTSDESPAWSPDGTKIAFLSDRDACDVDVYVMDANGQNQMPLTSNCLIVESPAWSPDGTKIAFARTEGSSLERDIYVMDADGQHERRLTETGLNNRFPAWR
jgi:Tol biopolymer transport system component